MNTKATEEKSVCNFGVLAGPSRDFLFDACKYACSGFGPKIDFSAENIIDDDIRARVRIIVDCLLMIEHEDGSGEKFLLRGYCRIGTNPAEESKRFEGFYDSRRRRGHLKVF